MYRRAVVAIVVGGLMVVGCSSSHPGSVDPAPSPESVSTLLPGGDIYRAFNADDGALVFTPGGPPDNVTRAQAIALAQSISTPGGFKATDSAFSGLVTLADGLGAPAIHYGTLAWIVQNMLVAEPSCPAQVSNETTNPSASGLNIMIVTGPQRSDVVQYVGVGGGVCGHGETPTATPES